MEFIEKKAKELFVSSSGLSKSGDQFGYGYPFLSYSEIFNNYYIPDKLLTLVNSTEKDRKKCSIQRGDVFLTRTSETTDELGMSCVALKDYPNATFNGFAKRLRPTTNEIVPEYSVYYFRSSYFRAQCMSMATLITRASLNDKMIERLRIRYPKDKDNQSKIANILMSYDKLIIANNKRIETLEQMAENLYKEWFVRFRFPGHETAEFENGIPKGWTIKRIDEIGEVTGGGTPSTEHPEYWDGDIPWLTPADLASFSDVFVASGKTFITAEGLKNSSTKELPRNTVLLSSRAPIGYVAIAKNAICTNQGFKNVICDTTNVLPVYLFYFFKNNKGVLESFASGSTFLELSGGRLKKIKLIVPSIDIQIAFYNIVIPWLEMTDILSQTNINLIKQRDLLLPRLMSGKLEVRNGRKA